MKRESKLKQNFRHLDNSLLNIHNDNAEMFKIIKSIADRVLELELNQASVITTKEKNNVRKTKRI